MSIHDIAPDEIVDVAPDPDEDGQPLFQGDTGTLELSVRNTLVTILKTRYISKDTHPAEWDCLMLERGTILSRLHDMFIDLHIDPNTATAFKTQAPTDLPTDNDAADPDDEPESLLTTRPWTVLQASLLIALRERFHRERDLTFDLPVYIDLDELKALGLSLIPPGHPDERLADKRVNSAIEHLRTMNILRKVYGADGRYRISPVVESLLPLNVIRALTEQWQQQSAAAGTTTQTDNTDGGQA